MRSPRNINDLRRFDVCSHIKLWLPQLSPTQSSRLLSNATFPETLPDSAKVLYPTLTERSPPRMPVDASRAHCCSSVLSTSVSSSRSLLGATYLRTPASSRLSKQLYSASTVCPPRSKNLCSDSSLITSHSEVIIWNGLPVSDD